MEFLFKKKNVKINQIKIINLIIVQKNKIKNKHLKRFLIYKKIFNKIISIFNVIKRNYIKIIIKQK